MTPRTDQTAARKSGAVLGSTQLLVMVLGGVLMILGVWYIALRNFPGLANPITGEVAAPTGDPNLGIDFRDLESLPDDYAAGASAIIAQEEAVLPEPLMGLAEASGFGLTYPVTESVDTVQPTLSWTLFAPGPYKVSVKDRTGQIVASAQNIFNTSWVVPAKLERGGVYTWEVSGVTSEFENAQFVILTTEQVAEWQRVRSQFSMSHLALGVMAEQLGMLSIAEREYQELGRQFPNAEAPARLLSNVQALRD
ncbi:MAG: hypothetical protein WDO18_16360 [Acidobacteriota bacterium]